jgi:pyridoxal 5'-phosphate synthase pdxS subunit
MVLDKLPFDVRQVGGIARTASVDKIREVMEAVSIPIMAKCRIGHTYEAKVLQATGVDMIDESEVLTPADEERHIWKWDFQTPFVCGARDLGEALRRIEEGAAMIRTKGEPGTGNVAHAIKHMRKYLNSIEHAKKLYENKDGQQLMYFARSIKVSLDTLIETCKLGRLPVVNFSAGGIATPADAAQMMYLGCDGIFVGSGIFKADDPENRARAVVMATTHFNDPDKVLEAQAMVDEQKTMFGIETDKMELSMQERGADI